MLWCLSRQYQYYNNSSVELSKISLTGNVFGIASAHYNMLLYKLTMNGEYEKSVWLEKNSQPG